MLAKKVYQNVKHKQLPETSMNFYVQTLTDIPFYDSITMVRKFTNRFSNKIFQNHFSTRKRTKRRFAHLPITSCTVGNLHVLPKRFCCGIT